MTDHNIISAEQWPEDAHAIVWDSDGQSLELHLFGSDWGLVYTHPNIDMPPDHDWRVPVMRPTCKESLPVAPTIDLEQFRGLLVFVRDGCKNGPIMQARARELLALIDGQASEQPSVAPVGVEGLMQLAREWCMSWGEWAHDADPGCVKENAAEAALRAALTAALAQQPAACPKCGGTGEADSGGIMPWGAPATIPCDCQQPAAVDGAASEAASAAPNC